MTCKDIRSSLGIMSTDVSTLDWPKNEILSFFKFLQIKVSQLDKRIFLHLLNESWGLATWFFRITTKLYKYVQFFDKPGNFFLQKVEKWQNVIFGPMSFLDQFNVETCWASPAQKSLSLRVIYSKNLSRDIFFVFWWTDLVESFLSYLPVKQMNLGRKELVCP